MTRLKLNLNETPLKFAQCILHGTHEGPTWVKCWLSPSGPNVGPNLARRGLAHESPSWKPVALYTWALIGWLAQI